MRRFSLRRATRSPIAYAGVAGLVDAYTSKRSLDRSLQKLLFAAEAAELAGNLMAETRNLTHFADRVARNSDRSMDPADAAFLSTLVGYL